MAKRARKAASSLRLRASNRLTSRSWKIASISTTRSSVVDVGAGVVVEAAGVAVVVVVVTTGAVAGGTTTGNGKAVVGGPAIEGARGKEPVEGAGEHLRLEAEGSEKDGGRGGGGCRHGRMGSGGAPPTAVSREAWRRVWSGNWGRR